MTTSRPLTASAAAVTVRLAKGRGRGRDRVRDSGNAAPEPKARSVLARPRESAPDRENVANRPADPRWRPRLRPPHPRLPALASSAPRSSGRPPRRLRRPHRQLPQHPAPRLPLKNRNARPPALRRKIGPPRAPPGLTVPIPLRRELVPQRLRRPLRPRPLRLRPLRLPPLLRAPPRPRHQARLQRQVPPRFRARRQLRA